MEGTAHAEDPIVEWMLRSDIDIDDPTLPLDGHATIEVEEIYLVDVIDGSPPPHDEPTMRKHLARVYETSSGLNVLNLQAEVDAYVRLGQPAPVDDPELWLYETRYHAKRA
jgi:hypothetical protein